MDFEACGVDDKRYDEKSDNSCDPVLDVCPLEVSLPSPSLIAAGTRTHEGHGKIAKLLP
jgi:hypothetical protein